MSGKYNWSSFQTLMLKYFKQKEFKLKKGTKTIRLATWTRGGRDIVVKYSHSKGRERLIDIKIEEPIRPDEKRVWTVDTKDYSFGFDELENSPYIRWEIHGGAGFYQINFPQK